MLTKSWTVFRDLGKPHSNSRRGHLGIALLAFALPPRTQTGTLGHFLPGRFERLCQITALRVYKCVEWMCNCQGKGFKKQNQEKVWSADKSPLDECVTKTTSRANKCPQVNFQGGQVPPGQVPVRTSSPNFPPASKNGLALVPMEIVVLTIIWLGILHHAHSFLPGTCPTGTCPTVTRRIGTCHPGTYPPGEFPALIFAHCLYAPSTCPQPPYYTWQAHPKDT